MNPDSNQQYPKSLNSDSKQTTPDREPSNTQTHIPSDSSYATGDKGRYDGGDTTDGRDLNSKIAGGGRSGHGRPPFLGEQFLQVPDSESKTPLYAVRNQKVVILTEDQLGKIKSGAFLVKAISRKSGEIEEKTLTSLNNNFESFSRRVIPADCPDEDNDGNRLYTVLLDYEESTLTPFPELQLVDIQTGGKQDLLQANNYLVVSFDDSGEGTNGPPTRPPITALQPLNSQLSIQQSDFRPLAPGDELNYKQHSGKDKGPAVAVLDTGLKFNLHNQHEENKWPDPYVYRDANNQKRRFILAYQDESTTDCGMTGNHLGYCALLAYRQKDFIERMKLKLLSNMPGPYTGVDVINSPFDDCVVLIDPQASLDTKNIKDARHGTSITAIIQQNGDNAPVLPVKAFDNLGYATLFDVLNGFNYILHRCKKSNIRVVNTSWIFNRDEPLLKRKISQLLEAGVLVVTASGNRGQTPKADLDENKVYPACYSVDLPNVITVTSIRETHFSPDTLAPKQDSVITKLLDKADEAGLSKIVDLVDDVVDAIVPVRGYVAVENYSRQFVNVGVVSRRGHFRSPFRNSPDIAGSSYACAFMTGFVIRQLRSNPGLLALLESGSDTNIKKVRQELLEATGDIDQNLAKEYTAGGYYLDGHAIDA